jgi:ribosomal protein S6--L-glutamate ligase/tetrahydromethanopterin:alpha-L-glutamate ligase
MDLLYTLERSGVLVVNHPKAIEKCVDKFFALTLLKENGLPVPKTIVTENVKEALKGFKELGEDVILKPLFGSRGVGSTRISDIDVATRIFNSIRFHHGVLYLQEFIHHGDSDVRAFVVNNHVVAAMQRIGNSWKTNVSQGARPAKIQLTEELEALAVKAANAVGCKVAGVDILNGNKSPSIIEVNSQPGWRGLQSVTKVNIADSIINYVLAEVKK